MSIIERRTHHTDSERKIHFHATKGEGSLGGSKKKDAIGRSAAAFVSLTALFFAAYEVIPHAKEWTMSGAYEAILLADPENPSLLASRE